MAFFVGKKNVFRSGKLVLIVFFYFFLIFFYFFYVISSFSERMDEIKRHELIPSSDTTAVKKQKTNVHVCSFNNTTRLPCSSESCPINQDDKKKRMMNIYSHC